MVASSFKIIAAVPDEKSRQEVDFIDCGDVVAELMPDWEFREYMEEW